jgi:hypothetical protein
MCGHPLAHWLSHRVQPLKKQAHPGWEYSGLQDLTQETQDKMTPELLLKHLGEICQDVSSRLNDEQVRPYHIRIETGPIRHPTQSGFHYFSKISYFNFFNAGHG